MLKEDPDSMFVVRLQDTNFGLKDLLQVKVIGAGAAGVVRLVEHNSTHTRYASLGWIRCQELFKSE